jgi:hypothetical protein
MNNIDILWIHNFLIRKFQNSQRIQDSEEYKNWKNLYDMVKEQEGGASNDVIENIKLKIKEMDISKNCEQFSFYLIQAIPLINEYKSLCQKQNKIYFMSSKEDQEANNKNENRKAINKILKSYFNLVQIYFPKEYENNDWDKIKTTFEFSDNPSKNSNKIKCLNCNNDSDNFIIHDNHLICEKCGCVSNTIHSNISYKDIDRVNITSKYTYDRRIHFRDCINQFQGKQNASIAKSVYDELIQQLVSHGIVPKNYSEMPKEKAFEKVTKEHILLFLKEIKQTKHYEDVVLIHHQLTGQPTPDISHLENVLLNDFDILVDTYDKKFKNSERKNFINTQYVLFQLLKRHRFPCKKEDFNMLKTVDRKYYHDVICSELFADIGWSFTALF